MESDNIFVSDDRLYTNLDIWELAEAPIFMISKMTRKYKYYALLSGADYPIVPMEQLLYELNLSYPKPFIDCTPYDKNNWIYHKFNSYGFYRRYKDCINRYVKNCIFRVILKVPVFYFSKYTLDKIYNPKRKLEQLGVKLYGGSAWWILPDKIIEYILNEYNKNDEYIKVLKKTHTPEETFYQIMAMRSSIANLVEINPVEMISQNCKTYAYFWSETKPFKGHPYEFTTEDFELLKEKAKDCYFAIKFDIDVNEEILDEIDKYLIGGSENVTF